MVEAPFAEMPVWLVTSPTRRPCSTLNLIAGEHVQTGQDARGR